ncbi:MAG TPA: hypothetical protein VEQ86_06955, partial [Xanthobacteraceae bacterium]|nr:hypothetical protein [Xanthobacteraceae bacterium]
MFAVVRKSRKNRDLADDVFAVVCQNAPIAGPIVGIFVGTSKAATTRCQHDGADRHGDPHEQAARKIVQAYRCWLHLLIAPTGGKLWRFAYRFAGKQ